LQPVKEYATTLDGNPTRQTDDNFVKVRTCSDYTYLSWFTGSVSIDYLYCSLKQDEPVPLWNVRQIAGWPSLWQNLSGLWSQSPWWHPSLSCWAAFHLHTGPAGGRQFFHHSDKGEH